MIRLTKNTTPGVLQKNFATWRQVLRDRLASGEQATDAEKTRYRHPDIKTALVNETAGKCAYCESKLRHITYGDVEHIIPKSVDPDKTFEWSNLTLACDICNTNKGTHFGNHEDLVDPYVVEPSMHLNFLGAMVLAKPGSGPGLATETTLQLNRSELLERRRDRLQSLSRQLHLLVEMTDQNKKAVLRKDLELHEITQDKEYAAMARTYLVEELRRIDEAMPPLPQDPPPARN